jgi:two-component system, OmpR family, KDP operon response regulator KdpE
MWENCPNSIERMNDVKALILVIEDDAQFRKFLRAALSSEGYRLVEVMTGAEALTQAIAHNPDLVLLDLGLPDLDGIEVTRRLREWGRMPIIVLSAREQEKDKIAALDAGADDYLSKPFGTGELMARMRVALRHAARHGQERFEPVISLGELRVDLDRRTVHAGPKEVHLTPTEYKLFVVLLKSADKVVTHRQLLKEVWGPSHTGNTQYLRVYMVQLRHKLEADPARPRHLVTVTGVGYRLRTDG